MDANEQHCAAYTRYLRSRNRSANTIENYLGAIEGLVDFHHEPDVMTLAQRDVEEFIIDLADTRSAGTAANRFRALRAFFNWAVSEEIIAVSPMAKMRTPAVEDRPPAVLPDDDLRRLFKACSGRTFIDRRDTAILYVLCEPGSPRSSELAGMGLDDLDMRRDLITLTGKGRKTRMIPFGPKTGQALDRYLRERRKHRLAKLPNLWLGTRGKPLGRSGVQDIIDRLGHQAGLGHLFPHQLRHTAASDWFDRGGSETEAMDLFGWSSRTMPQVYGRSSRIQRAHRASRRHSPTDRL